MAYPGLLLILVVAESSAQALTRTSGAFVDKPNECIFIFGLHFMGDFFIRHCNVPSFAMSFAGKDLTPVYAYHMLLDRYLEICDSMPKKANQIFNLRYQDLVKDPVATVGMILSNRGLPFSDEARRRMRGYIERNPKRRARCVSVLLRRNRPPSGRGAGGVCTNQAHFDVPTEV